jgi:hypothetical protein
MDIETCEPPRIEHSESDVLLHECERLRVERAATLSTQQAPMQKLPDDLLMMVFEKFQSSWGPWVPWAPVGWTPPPPLTPKHLAAPTGIAHEGTTQRMEREDFNTLRQNLCLVSQ